MKQARFDLWEAKDGWRWRLVAKNGRIIAESGEAYVRKQGAINAIDRLRHTAIVAAVPEQLQGFGAAITPMSLRAH